MGADCDESQRPTRRYLRQSVHRIADRRKSIAGIAGVAVRHDWQIVAEFSDKGISGAKGESSARALISSCKPLLGGKWTWC